MPSSTLSKLSGLTSTNFRSFSLGSGFGRLAGEVAQYAHHKGQFLQFDRVADLDVVGDLHARRSHPIQLMLCALSCHS